MLLDAHEAPSARPCSKRSSKYGSTSEVLPVAARVAAVHVDERDVEVQRRRGDELLAVVVRRRDRADLGLTVDDVGAEADAGRQERHPPRRGLQAEEEHALVELERSMTAPVWRAARKCGSSAIESSEHERVDDLA